ncbi:hypothetical protein [Azomonas macrocytogenes]|uniref:Uncharacterized protein n=1 Tax=Azomonas macrocytogenes TaxID=69962 RepID=A0A839T188_AZOMA|nr:hypothetical protein [Azomonas macrocytogenes]MBB3102164.1 hypothetical protein [Azomonas macrocytogenes]
MRISILGTNYKNSIFAGCLSFRGHTVIDVSAPGKNRDPLDHDYLTLEPGLRFLLDQGRKAGLLSSTSDLLSAVRETDLTFIDEVDSEKPGCMERLWCQLGEALRCKSAPHRLVIRTNRSPEVALADILPLLESSSGKRHGDGFDVEVRLDFPGQSIAALA